MLIRKVVLISSLMMVWGCSTIQIPDYIKADHPYVRKISGDYPKIVSVIQDVLFINGWVVQNAVSPSEYERRDGGEDQSRDVLFFTSPKRHSKIAYSVYVHLNVFIHATADGAEVDIRYEAINPSPIKHSSVRNDELVNGLLDQIEQAIESK